MTTKTVPEISWGRRLKGLLALIRFPATATTTVLMALLALCNAAGPISWSAVVLAALSYFCVSSSGFAINDYFDVDIDAINKPHRPIPAGILSRRAALTVFAVALLGSMALALLVNRTFAIVTISNAWLVAAYSAFLKRRGGLLANVLMGIYVALLVLSGVVALGEPAPHVFLTCAALSVYMIGNQVIMCIEDLKGDRAQGARTLPITIGIGKSLVVALTLMATGLVLLVLTYRGPFELVPLAGILAANVLIFARLIGSPTPQVAGRLRVFLALSMIMMVIVVILHGPRIVGDGGARAGASSAGSVGQVDPQDGSPRAPR
jgi:geranylgeranylglycerol-phosphate geranylgeranyltransferase